DRAAAKVYGHIRAVLEKQGIIVGHNNLVIASIVLAHQGILVTHNVREFQRIPALQVSDWTGEG
ncbi:MAG: type II toxin-antitoxin system VapC family toxin, partial [Treponema sp.]|nr:type II toxin-antitoxin system VapC family toxin [Treponema sp.]